MTAEAMPPPANTRCQIYYQNSPLDKNSLVRCPNEGTRWVKWSGCGCINGDTEDCMDDFYSWECGDHAAAKTEAA